MRSHYHVKNVRSVSPHIKLAVFEEAIRRQITMNDVIGEILATAYDKLYELSGEKTIGAEINGDQFRVLLPEPILKEVWTDARRTKQTESSVILGRIAERFGLIHEPVRKGRKGRAVASQP